MWNEINEALVELLQEALMGYDVVGNFDHTTIIISHKGFGWLAQITMTQGDVMVRVSAVWHTGTNKASFFPLAHPCLIELIVELIKGGDPRYRLP